MSQIAFNPMTVEFKHFISTDFGIKHLVGVNLTNATIAFVTPTTKALESAEEELEEAESSVW
jgi:hypothetical protein